LNHAEKRPFFRFLAIPSFVRGKKIKKIFPGDSFFLGRGRRAQFAIFLENYAVILETLQLRRAPLRGVYLAPGSLTIGKNGKKKLTKFKSLIKQIEVFLM
jgi:hypothetical protein